MFHVPQLFTLAQKTNFSFIVKGTGSKSEGQVPLQSTSDLVGGGKWGCSWAHNFIFKKLFGEIVLFYDFIPLVQ